MDLIIFIIYNTYFWIKLRVYFIYIIAIRWLMHLLNLASLWKRRAGFLVLCRTLIFLIVLPAVASILFIRSF